MKKLMKGLASLALVTAVMATGVAAAGTGSSTTKGFGGDITVTVTVSGGQITDVQYNCDKETAGDSFGQNACKVLAGNLKGQSGVNLDVVSGASVSSKGFIAAAQAAYDSAKAADTTAAATTTAAPETTKAETTTTKVTTTTKATAKEDEKTTTTAETEKEVAVTTPEVTTTVAETTTTAATTTTVAPETTKKEEPTTDTTESSEGGLNVPLVGGIIVVIALVGFFGFKKFGPKE